MPRAKDNKDNLKIEVNETMAGEVRRIVVTIEAAAMTFSFADHLRERGAIGAVAAPLKQAVREAVQTYLDEPEQLIAGLTGQGQKKPGNGAKPKPNGVSSATMMTEEHAPETDMLSYALPAGQVGAPGEVAALR